MLLHQRLASGALLPGIDAVLSPPNDSSEKVDHDTSDAPSAREFYNQKRLKLGLTENEPFPIYAYRKNKGLAESDDSSEGDLPTEDFTESTDEAFNAGDASAGQTIAVNDENTPQEALEMREKFIPISPKASSLFAVSNNTEKGLPIFSNVSSSLNPLIPVFQSGLFSDVSVFFCVPEQPQEVFRLHRIILCQAPFFKKLLVQQGKSNTLEPVRIFLDFDEHPLVTSKAVKQVFQALYCFNLRYEVLNKFDIHDLMAILAVACFFEVEYISDKAFQCLLRKTTPQNIVELANLTDSLVRTKSLLHTSRRHGPETYAFLSKYQAYLQQAYLGYICQLIGATAASIRLSAARIAELPWPWIEKVLRSDLLVIESEFSRYQLVKSAIQLRVAVDENLLNDASSETSTIQPSYPIAVSLGKKKEPASSLTASPHAKGVVGSFLDTFWTTLGTAKRKMASSSSDGSSLPAKQRKLNSSGKTNVLSGVESTYSDSEFEEGDTLRNDDAASSDGAVGGSESSDDDDCGLVHLRSLFNSPTKPPPRKPVSRPLGKVERMFRNGVVYTFMNFVDLEVIKKDRFIPERLVVEHFWLQQELAHFLQESQFFTNKVPASIPLPEARFPPFRFALSFKDIRKRLFRAGVLPSLGGQVPLAVPGEDSGIEVSNGPYPGYKMHSLPVTCAGFQFRVSLEIMTDHECDQWAAKSGVSAPDGAEFEPQRMSQSIAANMRPHPQTPSKPSSGAEASFRAELRDENDRILFRPIYLKAVLQIAAAPNVGRTNSFSTPSGSKSGATFTEKLCPKVPLSYKIYAFQESLLESPFKQPLLFDLSKDKQPPASAVAYTTLESASSTDELFHKTAREAAYAHDEGALAGLEWLAYSEPVAVCNRFEQGYVVPFSLISKVKLDTAALHLGSTGAEDATIHKTKASSAGRKKSHSASKKVSSGMAKYGITDVCDFTTLVVHISFQ